MESNTFIIKAFYKNHFLPCLSKENIFKVTADSLDSEWNSEVTMFELTLLSLERQDDEMRRLENNRKLVFS